MKFIDELIKNAEERNKQKEKEVNETFEKVLEEIDSLCKKANEKGKTEIIYGEVSLTKSIGHTWLRKFITLEKIEKALQDNKLEIMRGKEGPFDVLGISWSKLMK